MTMKRILHCTLMLMVLVTAGCWFDNEPTSTSNANTSPTPQAENTIDFAGAETDVRDASEKLKSPAKTGQLATVKPVKDDINNASQKLGKAERDRCTNCTEDTKNAAAAVLQTINGISTTLGKDPQKQIVALDEDVREKLQQDLNAQADKLKDLTSAAPRISDGPSPSLSPVQSEPTKNQTGDPWWWSTLVLALEVVGGLLALILLASALTYLWKRSWKTVEFNVGQVLKSHLAATREAQPDYAPKLSSLSSTQSEMSSRLNDLDSEVRSLARLVRESLATRRPDHNPSYSGLNYSHVESVSPKDEPDFPVSAVDYLGKMNRFANVVRPDFQNGILVNDPDGDGELVLIRDSRDDTQPLFVVPRATQFQTKQDFYTYYQKYYDCVRPSAGDVWIIGPAVVEKVTGGWQLREKGMLEIR